MNKILIALDFSDSCNNAIAYVKNLIQGTSIKVDMVHVYSIPVTSLTSISADAASEIIEGNKTHINNLLDNHMSTLPQHNQGNTYPVYGVYASSDIVDKANEVGADLIVMALRQKYSLIDRFIGTVTAHTISKSAIPVLAIPNGCTYNSTCKILFPTELPYANTLSDKMADQLDRLFGYCNLYTNPEVYMVHINEGEGVDVVYNHKPIVDLNFIVSNALNVDEGIKKILEKHNVDLIAIQKKSRKFWERLYHSSVTRKLLFQTRLPILIFTS